MSTDNNEPKNTQRARGHFDEDSDPTDAFPPSDVVPAGGQRSSRNVGAYAVWRNGDYRLFAVSWFLLVFGKMVETVAVQVYIYRRTGDALSLGIIGLVQALPVILLAIPGGQVRRVGRFRRVGRAERAPPIF